MGVLRCLARNNGRKYHQILLETTFISFPPSLPVYIFLFPFQFFLSNEGRKRGNGRKNSRQVGGVWDRRKCWEPGRLPPGGWLCTLRAPPGSWEPWSQRAQKAAERQPKPGSGWPQTTEQQINDLLERVFKQSPVPPWGCQRNTGISCLQAVPAPVINKPPGQASNTQAKRPTVLHVHTRLRALLHKPHRESPEPQPPAQESANPRQEGLPRSGARPRPAAEVACLLPAHQRTALPPWGLTARDSGVTSNCSKWEDMQKQSTESSRRRFTCWCSGRRGREPASKAPLLNSACADRKCPRQCPKTGRASK